MNVNYIQTDKGGVSNARNLAIDVMKGDYFTCLDDDDFLSRSCLAEMSEKANPQVVVECYPSAFIDQKPYQTCSYGLTDVYDYCTTHKCTSINSKARKFLSGPCMKLIPTSFIRDKRFSEKFKIGEDSLFMFSISDRISEIVYTSKEAIYYRRRRKGSASSTIRPKGYLIKNNISLIKEFTKIYSSGKYSTFFYLSRVVALMISIIKQFK